MAIELEMMGDSLKVVITAGTFLRDLLLQADRLGPAAVADRGLVTLLPGERVTMTVTGLDERERAGLEISAVHGALFCVNAAQLPAEEVSRS
jgi:beta-mannosidase